MSSRPVSLERSDALGVLVTLFDKTFPSRVVETWQEPGRKEIKIQALTGGSSQPMWITSPDTHVGLVVLYCERDGCGEPARAAVWDSDMAGYRKFCVAHQPKWSDDPTGWRRAAPGLMRPDPGTCTHYRATATRTTCPDCGKDMVTKPKLTSAQRTALESAAAGIGQGEGGIVKARRDTINRLRVLGLVEQVGRGITPDGLRAIGWDGLITPDGRVDLRIRNIEVARREALDDYASRDWVPDVRQRLGTAAVDAAQHPIKTDDVVRDADGTTWKVIVVGRTTIIVEDVERPGRAACFPGERVTVVDQDAEMATLIGEQAWALLDAIRRDGVDAVKRQVAAIGAEAGDDPRAHAHEDALHQAVLAAIATELPFARELAREALKTCSLDFSRWVD